MKKNVKIVVAAVAIVGGTLVMNAKPKRYSVQTKIVNIDSKTGYVSMKPKNGLKLGFYKSDMVNYNIGDKFTYVMDNNGTPWDNTDDGVIEWYKTK